MMYKNIQMLITFIKLLLLIVLFVLFLQGIAFDHIELNFYLNGKSLDAPIMGVKGTMYPVLYGKK